MLTKTKKNPPISTLIKYRLKLRKKMEDKEAAHKREMAQYRAKRDDIDIMIIDFLDSTGQKMAKTVEGTASTSMRPSASVADGEVFMDYVIENKEFQLLNRAVNPTAAKDFVEQHGKVPPGVNFSQVRTVNVRSPQ